MAYKVRTSTSLHPARANTTVYKDRAALVTVVYHNEILIVYSNHGGIFPFCNHVEFAGDLGPGKKFLKDSYGICYEP